MKGPKYIETNLQTLISRRQEYNKHVETLKSIRCDPAISTRIASKQLAFMKEIQNNRQALLTKRDQEKTQSIVKQNVKIFNKILQMKDDPNISRENSRLRADSARSLQSNSSKVKKYKSHLLDLENKRLKIRIINAQASFAFKKSEKDFMKHQIDKARITRNSSQKQQYLSEMVKQFAHNKNSMASKSQQLLPSIGKHSHYSRTQADISTHRI